MLLSDSYYHWVCDHTVTVSILITNIKRQHLSLVDCADGGRINRLVVIMHEPQADVYISDLGKQTKSNDRDAVPPV